MPSNTELLGEIKEMLHQERTERVLYQKQNSLDFCKLATEFSDYRNKAEPITQRLLGYMENDNTTNQKGIVSQVGINTAELSEIKTKDKVRVGQVVVIGFVFGIVGSFVMNMIKYISAS